MREHILSQIRFRTKAYSPPLLNNVSDPISIRNRINAKISMLHIQSRRGLWGILQFILISIFALLLFETKPLDELPDILMIILGNPPTPFYINILLIVSSISAIIIVIVRIIDGVIPKRLWPQVIFRAAFYLLYFFSGALLENFILILSSGVIILAMEHYNIWKYYSKAITKEKDNLRKFSLWPMSVCSAAPSCLN